MTTTSIGATIPRLATDEEAAVAAYSQLTPGTASRRLKDAIATAVMWGAFALAMIPLAWILWTVTSQGFSLLTSSGWWTLSQRNINATDVGGGAVHAIQGTLIQGLVTAAISVPLGLFTAIYLVEYGQGRLARVVSFMVDILSGVPSIVAALFVYAVWVTTFGFQRVGFAVCLALVLLMIPVVVRSTEEMLKLVPNELREASYALGVPKWVTIVKVVLPTAFSGIITGILLGLARVMGETAPLLILGPYTTEHRDQSLLRLHAHLADDDQPRPHRTRHRDRSRADVGDRAHAHPPRPPAQRRRPDHRQVRRGAAMTPTTPPDSPGIPASRKNH
ncbi:MAG: phosphate ABC transporter permease PstA [Dermatophilaceae bacterium]